MLQTLCTCRHPAPQPEWHEIVHILHERGFPSDRYIFGIGVATDASKGEPYVILDQPSFGLDRDILALGERGVPFDSPVKYQFFHLEILDLLLQLCLETTN